MIDYAKGLKLLYRGSKDGFLSKNFTCLCGDQGATLSIIQSNNRIFGGFTDIPWNK